MTQSLLNSILQGVFLGEYSVNRLPVDLYTEVFETLKKRYYDGYGNDITDVELNDSFLINMQSFSSAKVFQNINDLQNLLANDVGVNYDDFKELASKINNRYNYAWLDVEGDYVQKQGISVKQWEQIEATKDVLPLLKYVTAGDERVRDEHARLDGIVRPVGDRFWSMYYVPNGYRCRCEVIQLEEGEEEITTITKKMNKEFVEDVPMMFRINPAKDKYLFVEEGYGVHPYFVVPSEYEDLKKQNFNLPELV